ncbi:MAG: hypothetical protein ACXV3D_04145 [Halobacteriota archaeon]
MILPGVQIGDGAVIAGGSIVTKTLATMRSPVEIQRDIFETDLMTSRYVSLSVQSDGTSP